MTRTAAAQRESGPLTPFERQELVWLRHEASRLRRPSDLWGGMQVASCVLPSAALWVAMAATGPEPTALTVALAALNGLFMLRLFGLYHDLAHASLFVRRTTNEVMGCIIGVLTLTPFHQWRAEHARHHAGVGNLDRRGYGDVPLMTVEEYEQAGPGARLLYRLFRCPPITLVGAGLLLFVVRMRMPHRDARPSRRASVHLTTLGSAALLLAGHQALGTAMFCATVGTTVVVMSSCAMWLYNLQHFFPGMIHRRNGEWDYSRACLEGSSYYRLPRVLRWFAANTGYHHLHHLFPRVPNHRLARCQGVLDGLRVARRSPPVTLRASLAVLGWGLYDEHAHAPVGFERQSLAGLGEEDASHAGS